MVVQPDLESPTGYPESPLDQDDILYPCKGCGEILEEGKAFELAGKRWHIDCFRCNTCSTLLDSDANLLLLGDGSLICNNCTYSCSSCGNKIEDLAILTGDQAFCANCFKCRNCKRKIENLRYARTSQGIFCMDCHESLMARRRKRTARNAAQRQKPPPPNALLDKSLPSLPPRSPLPPDGTPSTDPYSVTPTEPVPRSRPDEDRHHTRNERNDLSSVQNAGQDNLILPSSTYRSNRHSMMSHKSEVDGAEEFLIPVAFDPNPDHHSPRISSSDNQAMLEERPQDYFPDNSQKHIASQRQQSGLHEAQPEQPSPHIAYQEKRRTEADAARKRQDSQPSSNVSGTQSPALGPDRIREQNAVQRSSKHEGDGADKFKLQDVPKGKRTGGSETERSSTDESFANIPSKDPARNSNQRVEPSEPSGRRSDESRTRDSESSKPGPTVQRTGMQYPPKRGDSLESKLHHVQRKDVAQQSSRLGQVESNPESAAAASSSPAANVKTSESAPKRSFDSSSTPIASPHSRNDSRDKFTPTRASQQGSLDSRIASNHARNESVNTLQSEPLRTDAASSLLRYSVGGEFTMDEDMSRIMGDEGNQNSESFLRRVSNSVRHGRSFSDKGSRLSKEQKWPKSPSGSTNFAQDISSPSTSSPDNRDELAWYKNELRRERQKVLEKEQKISELEASLNATVNIKQVNTELREKRSTMVFLDTQKEIVLRELEVLTEHIAAEKQSGAPLDLGKMNNSVVREFAESMQRLKDSFAPQIEELILKRNDLLEEISNLGRMKDKSFQEFEQLSSKNAQLAELNNQLVHQIQELYKANSNSTADGGRQGANGLGIYSHQKDKSSASLDARDVQANLAALGSSGNIHQEEAEPVTVLQGPQVVSIRKGQPRKFNWKKGQTVAKGVTKGLKGAFMSAEGRGGQQRGDAGHFTETAPYGSLAVPDGASSAATPRSQSQSQDGYKQSWDPYKPAFGFFGNQKNKPAQNKGQNGSSPAIVDASAAAAALFGSELEQRIEVEKGVIPFIVTRCIEEVELRGMDVEGIYRKSGGSSQVQIIRDSFENSTDFDISDPDLDIHAVTSTLKQYFRKLPTPLITFPVYDKLLEAGGVTPVSARIDVMQRGLADLPRVHRDVLEFLVFHLKRVVDREKENLMTSTNVAVVFAPTILRPESLSREMTDVQRKNEALQFLVDNCQDIFMGIEEEQ
ncbi:hypothetical protein AJ80_07086 [Polytolypa hystricis UAMH7299]|uniref:Uncharacterized protein n=1 Tax=Polytolypa hystricis (strain UAMH7299) TaxID=1447883 RepID=A0A2B7XRB7_POLH7|nr:hypothetical protein AJ80_07086 [Polytolypa hystricis UAMH7299]